MLFQKKKRCILKSLDLTIYETVGTFGVPTVKNYISFNLFSICSRSLIKALSVISIAG